MAEIGCRGRLEQYAVGTGSCVSEGIRAEKNVDGSDVWASMTNDAAIHPEGWKIRRKVEINMFNFVCILHEVSVKSFFIFINLHFCQILSIIQKTKIKNGTLV